MTTEDARERRRASHRRYNTSEKGRARGARYDASPKGQETRARYEDSPAGRESRRRRYESEQGDFFRRNEKLLKDRRHKALQRMEKREQESSHSLEERAEALRTAGFDTVFDTDQLMKDVSESVRLTTGPQRPE